MELKDQVCSLELAKKLKKLGVKQESLFFHDDQGRIIYWGVEPKECMYSAFTVAELGEILPWRVQKENRFYVLECEKGGKPWYWVNYEYGETRDVDFDCWTEESNTEADARAKMLIRLLENNLLTAL